jgi:transposase
LERFTKTFSIAEHLLAAVESLDRSGPVPESLGPRVAPTGRDGTDRLGRSPGRRHICPGKKRGLCVGKTKRGKGTKIMLLVDGHGTPLGTLVASASPAEVTLIEPLLEHRVRRRSLQRLIYDRAADSDPLRERLARRGLELICPHRKNRRRPKTQDGRPLRRYQRRWKIERSISWLFNFRRLVVRYEYHAHLFQGLVDLACLYTTLQRF